MTGQSTRRPAARSPERTAQPPSRRGSSAHAQADRGHGDRPAPKRGVSARGGRLARPRADWVLPALPALGALVDEVWGAPLGGFFLVCSVLGSAWAALLVTRHALWWVVPSPPLVIAAVAFLDQLLLHSSDFAGARLGAGVLRWSVDLFPTMVFALLAAAAAPAVRHVLAGRSAVRTAGRDAVRAAGRGARVPLPRRSDHG